MTTQAISKTWTCTRCGQENEVYNETTFKELCLTLLAGNRGLVICRRCDQTDQVMFKGGRLELVVAPGA